MPVEVYDRVNRLIQIHINRLIQHDIGDFNWKNGFYLVAQVDSKSGFNQTCYVNIFVRLFFFFALEGGDFAQRSNELDPTVLW